MTKALVLGAGALIGIERRSPAAAAAQAGKARQLSIVVPTAAVAQVVRGGGRQTNLRRFLADSCLRFVGLDYRAALRIGSMLGQSGTTDVVDAAVVGCARDLDQCPVVTTDPDDVRKLDPATPVIVV